MGLVIIKVDIVLAVAFVVARYEYLKYYKK